MTILIPPNRNCIINPPDRYILCKCMECRQEKVCWYIKEYYWGIIRECKSCFRKRNWEYEWLLYKEKLW